MGSGSAVTLLAPAERELLRELALAAVTAAAAGHPAPDAWALAARRGLGQAPRLAEKRGAFVTLHLAGQLRGCIGHIEGHLPLLECVARNGRAAAREDPRFPPVTPAEVPRLAWEISALTPLRQVAGPAEIEIGRHGILMSRGGRQAVFLPQVAVEQGWNVETTLGQLALKAGLAADAWREGAEFRVFEAEVF